jgi:hypothetical protein
VTPPNPAYAPRTGIVERWLARNRMMHFAPLWVTAAFGIALPVFHHPTWLTFCLGLAALGLGSVLGGADRASGSEEYAMALPPSRREQYWVKAALGLVIPLSSLAGILIIRFDVATRFWSLFCSSGWTGSYAALGSTAAYLAALIVPTSLFAVTYAGSSLGGLPSGFLCALAIGAVSAAGAAIETSWFGVPNGRVLLPLNALTGAGALLAAYPRYLRRDVASGPQRQQGLTVAVIVLILMMLLGLFFLGSVTPRTISYDSNLQERGPPETISVEMSKPVPEKGEAP